MPEQFLIHSKDGPNPGSRLIDTWSWPLPEILLADGGVYIKTSESQLPPMPPGTVLIRSAYYQWQEGDPTAEQLTAAISTALKTRRLDEAVALLHILVTVDVQRAEDVYDILATVTLADAGG